MSLGVWYSLSVIVHVYIGPSSDHSRLSLSHSFRARKKGSLSLPPPSLANLPPPTPSHWYQEKRTVVDLSSVPETTDKSRHRSKTTMGVAIETWSGCRRNNWCKCWHKTPHQKNLSKLAKTYMPLGGKHERDG